jgi:putative transposase
VRARTRSHLWSPSSFAASAGAAPLPVIKRYIEKPKRPI